MPFGRIPFPPLAEEEPPPEATTMQDLLEGLRQSGELYAWKQKTKASDGFLNSVPEVLEECLKWSPPRKGKRPLNGGLVAFLISLKSRIPNRGILIDAEEYIVQALLKVYPPFGSYSGVMNRVAYPLEDHPETGPPISIYTIEERIIPMYGMAGFGKVINFAISLAKQTEDKRKQ